MVTNKTTTNQAPDVLKLSEAFVESSSPTFILSRLLLFQADFLTRILFVVSFPNQLFWITFEIGPTNSNLAGTHFMQQC